MTDAKFNRHFGTYVCAGDTIETTVGPLRLVATIEHYDGAESPDENGDGFWPSLDPEAAGYIGRKSRATLERQTARAQSILDAWNNDDWFYCGIVVQAYLGEVKLGAPVSLWNIEANYPTFSKRDRARQNHYLREVADELIPEALESAEEALDALLEDAEAYRQPKRPDAALAALQRLLAAMETPRTAVATSAWDNARAVVAELTKEELGE